MVKNILLGKLKQKKNWLIFNIISWYTNQWEKWVVSTSIVTLTGRGDKIIMSFVNCNIIKLKYLVELKLIILVYELTMSLIIGIPKIVMKSSILTSCSVVLELLDTYWERTLFCYMFYGSCFRSTYVATYYI